MTLLEFKEAVDRLCEDPANHKKTVIYFDDMKLHVVSAIHNEDSYSDDTLQIDGRWDHSME